jgi:hypothetical protein
LTGVSTTDSDIVQHTTPIVKRKRKEIMKNFSPLPDPHKEAEMSD